MDNVLSSSSQCVSADTDYIPLAEYPRPQLVRDSWICLNGWWDYAIRRGVDAAAPIELLSPPTEYDGSILVPFSPETELSGVGEVLHPGDQLWYRRSVTVPECFGSKRLLVNFEAVDWECVLFANGQLVGFHEGGYEPFTVDVTDSISFGAESMELVLCVRDPSEEGGQPRGKQCLQVEGKIWYPAQSGIWQTVWAEVVQSAHVVSVVATGDPDSSLATVEVEIGVLGEELTITLIDGGRTVGQASCVVNQTHLLLTLHVVRPHLWSVDDPHLYDLVVCYGSDRVRSYLAFRTTTVESDGHGIPRFCLNHKPMMIKAVLNQGYWQEGLMTAPSDDDLVRDIKAARELGFNALRMHIKVERRRFYAHCDHLGMLVIQDMVSGGQRMCKRFAMQMPSRRLWMRRHVNDRNPFVQHFLGARDRDTRYQWLQESLAHVKRMRGYPCVVAWSVFNEGWGQFDSTEVVGALREVDATRPFDAASGWFDQGFGDFESVHDYTEGQLILRKNLQLRSRDKHGEENRALFLSEFGGLAYRVANHCKYDDAWGYRFFDNHEAFIEAFCKVLADVEVLWDEGLAGYVYTQLSDIERECNGLLTYDRVVKKACIAESRTPFADHSF